MCVCVLGRARDEDAEDEDAVDEDACLGPEVPILLTPSPSSSKAQSLFSEPS